MDKPLPAASAIENRFRSLGRLIGNTPMLAIEFRFRGSPRVLYAKSEQLNMTGSIKDRIWDAWCSEFFYLWFLSCEYFQGLQTFTQ